MLITTLAHEFIHVRQFDTNELAFLSNCSRWRGKYYTNDEFIDAEEPWEIEPRESEYVLADKFFAQ
jgi:hypothetical protein